MKLGIYGRVLNDNHSVLFFNQLIGFLQTEGIEFLIDGSFRNYLKLRHGIELNVSTFSENDNVADKFDYLISLGGDGTLLDTVSIVKDSGLPVLGVNTGRLGFLASISREEFRQAIDDLSKGAFTLDKRSLLQLNADRELFNGFNFALNDFVIHRKDSASMITVQTYLNGEFLNSYWADGLIISTPTGSSGYSLSCGGPVIFPKSASFVITPIAPHNLNVRPIIVSDESVLSFEVESRSNTFLASIDARSTSVDTNIQIAVKKADFTLNLVRFSHENYLDTLRKKLMWGVDQRN